MSRETSPLLASSQDNERTNYTQNQPVSEAGETGAEEQIQVEPLPSSYLAFVIPMAVGIFLTAADGTIIVSSYAAIGSEFNELQNTSWIATAYLLTLTSFQPLYGKLSDIFGRKTCLLFAYTIFAIGCLFCGLATNMNQLIISRAFAGIGGGGMQTVVSIIMSDIVPLRSRGTWQGVLNIIFASGNTAGAALGGILADTIGWRWAFLLQVPLIVVAIAAVYFSLHLPKTTSSDFSTNIKRVDFLGAISLVSAIFFLLFGMDRGGNIAWQDKWTIGALMSFVFLTILFVYIELKVANEPFAPKRIVANRAMIASYLVNFFGIAAGMSVLFYISLYFQAVLGNTASQASAWLIIAVVGALVGSLGGGLLMQATGKYYILTVSAYALQFIGCLTILLTTGGGFLVQSSLGIAIGLVVSSLGNGTGITSSLISLIANAGQADQAIATAVSYLFRSLGSVVGLSIGSTLIQDTLRSSLHRKLSGQDVDEIIRRVRESLNYIDELDPATQEIVRSSYGLAVKVTFAFSLGMAACGFLSSLFIIEKPLLNRK